LEDGEYLDISSITKDDLLQLASLATNEEVDFEMQEYDERKLQNKAHMIIYKNLYDKFQELIENKSRFSDEAKRLYKDAYDKYVVSD